MTAGRAAVVALAALVACVAVPRLALARVARFAVVVGHDQGDADEQNLRYAETDAARVRDVLVDLGGFAAEDVTLLQGRSADEVRRALITVNDRIRAQPASDEAMLLVFFSGHADAEALHLGGSHLDIDELEKLVRGSSARMRLLVVDACRSGALTRVKGGQAAPSFAIALDEGLASEGVIFLTSSAATEDAQESDELKGSFFTHYFVSGLLGAADGDGDGLVTLVEAYRHAYDNTLRASSRTQAGLQHPTFRYALAGRGDVVLTRIGAAGDRGRLKFPKGHAYLILAGDADGPVVAEVGVADVRRVISLRPGRYFIRGRRRAHLLEGPVTVARGEERVLDDRSLQSFEYARVVRKGGAALTRAWSLELGGAGHGTLPNAERPCLGGGLGVGLDLAALGVGARVAWCRAGYDNATLEAEVDEASLELRAWRSVDLPWFTLTPSVSLGGGVFAQRFDTSGVAPARTSAFGLLGVELRLARDLRGGLFVYAEGGLATLAWPGATASVDAALVWRAGVGAGWHL